MKVRTIETADWTDVFSGRYRISQTGRATLEFEFGPKLINLARFLLTSA